jgi:hypothetical protein
LPQMKPLRPPQRARHGRIIVAGKFTHIQHWTYRRPNVFTPPRATTRANPHGYWTSSPPRPAARQPPRPYMRIHRQRARRDPIATNSSEQQTTRTQKIFAYTPLDHARTACVNPSARRVRAVATREQRVVSVRRSRSVRRNRRARAAHPVHPDCSA